MEQEIHPIQSDILLVLLFKPKARFVELNTTKMPSDHFNFHIKRLVKLDLIEKTKGGYYKLTPKGKEFANRFDTESQFLERQAKIGVLVCCVGKSENDVKYLIQQRLKEPYYGFYGFITGKVKWGEEVEETAKRELKEEAGLAGEFRLVGIKHKMDYSSRKDLLEDKFFFVFRVTNTKGKLINNFEGGKNLWLTQKEIFKLKDLFDGVDESIQMVKKDDFVFSETKYKVKRY